MMPDMPATPKLATVACDLCGSARYRVAYRVQDTNYGLPGRFAIVTCVECGLSYLNPRPSGAALAAYYPPDYHPFRAARRADGRPPQPAPLQQQRARQLSAAGSGHALDVGCGSGLFLLALRELGWTVCGIEPDSTAVAWARATLGLTVIEGTIDDHPHDDARYDLVTLWDVLEHTPSPSYVLRTIATRLLRPGGTLALNVPNYASLERAVFGARWTALDAPRHLTHFTPPTLRRMVENAGLRVTHVATDAPVLTLASNVLRLAGDVALRGGRAKVPAAQRRSAADQLAPPRPPAPGRLRQRAIDATHAALRPVNALANRLGRGATIQLTAELADV